MPSEALDENVSSESEFAQLYLDFTQILLSESDLHELAIQSLNKLHRSLPFDQGSIALFSFDTRQAEFLAGWSEGKSYAMRNSYISVDTIESVTSLKRGHNHIINEVVFKENGDLSTQSLLSAAIQSYGIFPLMVDDRLYGYLSIGSGRKNFFNHDRVDSVRKFADLVALSVRRILQKQRFTERLKSLEMQLRERASDFNEQYQRQVALGEIEVSINIPHQLHEVLDRITDVTTKLLPASGGASVVLWDPQLEEFYLRSIAVIGEPAKLFFDRVRRDEGSTRWIVDHRAPLIVPDIQGGPFGMTKMLGDIGCQAYVGVPLIIEGEVLGVLYAVDLAPRDYSKTDIEFLEALSRRSAVAIAKAILYEQIQASNQLLEQKTQDLEFLNQELQEFASIVSHDLKAPLRGIRSIADWISKDYSDRLDDDGQSLFKLLIRRVDRMHQLIDGVLQYTQAGRANARQETIDLNMLVADVIEMVNPTEKILIKYDQALPEIRGDSTRISQVFQNLLSNAAKYSDKEETLIQIGYEDVGSEWQFSISDNGRGIDPGQFEHIFQLFQTVDPIDGYESTGLGLAVTKKLIEAYGGKIWVESQIGVGSTFFFTIPKIHGGQPSPGRLARGER